MTNNDKERKKRLMAALYSPYLHNDKDERLDPCNSVAKSPFSPHDTLQDELQDTVGESCNVKERLYGDY